MKNSINLSIKSLFDEKKINTDVKLTGWIKFIREHKSIIFIEFMDGSIFKTIQLVIKRENFDNFEDIKDDISIGSAIEIFGTLIENNKNELEIICKDISVIGKCIDEYPLQNKIHGNEFLREISHIRSRTKYFNIVFDIRSFLFNTINNYFYKNNFKWVSTPILSSSDAEGAGDVFNISDKDFFNSEASLSVTGQLHLEAMALSYKNVYTLGPQFRAEKSHTSRHLSEFWMLEAEMNFMNLDQLMIFMEDMVKHFASELLKNKKDEIAYLDSLNNGLIDKLENLVNNEFAKKSYREAIEILKEARDSKKVTFQNNDIDFGTDLDSEHERYLCEKHFQKPTFIYNYPTAIKAFYMKRNNDETVKGVDLLVPLIGELCGGSERENNHNNLMENMKDKNIPLEELSWYLELRKYGYASSSGFGMGFERLIMFLTGVENIKDTIPFARAHENIKF